MNLNQDAMKNRFYLTPRSKEDLWEIWDYTVSQWGEVKADEYYNKILLRCKWLGNNQHVGKLRNEIKEGYKSFYEGKHTILSLWH